MKKGGFTLIELLVVVSIISLLSSVVLSSLNSARDKGRLGGAKSFAAQSFRVAGDYAVGVWDLDDGAGTVARDRSGSGNNGTLVNSPAWSADTPWNVGGSVLFDGTNDYIEVPYSAALAPTSAITYSAWFKPASLSGGRQILSKTQTGGYQLSINENSACALNSLCGLIHISGSYHSVSYPASALVVGRWYHALVTYDGEVMKLYLDGKEVAANAAPSGSITYSSNNALCIGAEPSSTCSDGNYFSGNIEDVRVYAKALVASEIGDVYASDLHRSRVALE
ncbi:MAG: LamG domain-containing protein [Candidatus Taylorbacteria bacterium]|nr:LamG domain-containing protein [Candidatus Taylorbacteria bacterium]